MTQCMTYLVITKLIIILVVGHDCPVLFEVFRDLMDILPFRSAPLNLFHFGIQAFFRGSVTVNYDDRHSS